MKLSNFSYDKKDVIEMSLSLGLPIHFSTERGKSKVYAICGTGLGCSGGGGQCGTGLGCSGGGGQCGTGLGCGGW